MNQPTPHIDAHIVCPVVQVRPQWIDYNGHMNMAYYHVVFDRGVDHAYDLMGVGEAYVAQGGSCFTREVQVNYIQELTVNEDMHVTWQLLDHDSKRLHFFEHMRNGAGDLVATSEQLALHVDMQTRRTAPFPAAIEQRIEAVMAAHAALPRPDQAGRPMGIRRS